MPRAVYLRSKVGRRVVGLFFLCAALPTGLLTVMSYRRITADLESAALMRLARESKNVGLMVLDRLAALRETVIELSHDLRPVGRLAATPPLKPGFNWLAVRGRDGRW